MYNFIIYYGINLECVFKFWSKINRENVFCMLINAKKKIILDKLHTFATIIK